MDTTPEYQDLIKDSTIPKISNYLELNNYTKPECQDLSNDSTIPKTTNYLELNNYTTIEENIPATNEAISKTCSDGKVVDISWRRRIGFICLNLVLVIIVSVLTFIAMMYITERRNEAIVTCDAGWFLFGRYCYYFGKEKKTWEDAERECKHSFGHFVNIEDATENWFLKSVVAQDQIGDTWIGARKIVQQFQTTSYFRWVSDNSEVNFADWAPEEPKGTWNHDCVYFWANASYKWDDNVCSFNYGYICKK